MFYWKKSLIISLTFLWITTLTPFFFPKDWDRLGHFFVFYPYNYLYSYKIKIIIIITVQATANGLHQAMTGFLNGPFPPYLLTEHLAHSLDGPGPSSQLDWTSSIIPRLRNNALGGNPPAEHQLAPSASSKRVTLVTSSRSHMVRNITQRDPPTWKQPSHHDDPTKRSL